MCVVLKKLDEKERILGCWGWREGDISGDALEKEMESLLVIELVLLMEVWCRNRCVRWWK